MLAAADRDDDGHLGRPTPAASEPWVRGRHAVVFRALPEVRTRQQSVRGRNWYLRRPLKAGAAGGIVKNAKPQRQSDPRIG